MEPSKKRYLLSSLNLMFDAFDKTKDNVVPFDEFATGMSILCAGVQTEKLYFAYLLFDSDGDGNLSRRQLFRLLKSVLTAVNAISESARSMEPHLLHYAQNQAAKSSAELCYEYLNKNLDESINFYDFLIWVEQAGEDATWLQLMHPPAGDASSEAANQPDQ
eukprot:TRINITY_DN5230_c0_g1_i7.p2 TRINITY_DN5230_c0_g1~~TRINITY_DN5230_c0_g1_i7.p2  ORF type:complete len:162 (+),score=50.05 TRINITY_DN5230_c0_g1_i7:259-744(+)